MIYKTIMHKDSLTTLIDILLVVPAGVAQVNVSAKRATSLGKVIRNILSSSLSHPRILFSLTSMWRRYSTTNMEKIILLYQNLKVNIDILFSTFCVLRI